MIKFTVMAEHHGVEVSVFAKLVLLAHFGGQLHVSQGCLERGSDPSR